ncbi:hypothetical protein [Actinocrispum sp. NPDC049592]|uniref:hypothetical protein n=1 Tax=Actinocrispum sp. NPDC049592 TaxID=3154835 RepID=UPI0034359A0A
MAWSLRDNARFLPFREISRHALAQMDGHAMTGYVPPAPVTGEAVINYPGLIMFALHLTAICIAVAAWAVRRRWNVHSVLTRVVFAGVVAIGAAAVTLPIAGMSLGTAILFSGTVAAAMAVLQYTFVLVLVGTAFFGVP